MDFPAVSRQPNRERYIQSLLQDPTISADFENGFQLARSKYSNVALKFEFTLSFLTAADKSLLESFEKERSYRAGEFNWTSPYGITYIVRFDINLVFTQERASNFWNVPITLVEIRPNTSEDIS